MQAKEIMDMSERQKKEYHKTKTVSKMALTIKMY